MGVLHVLLPEDLDKEFRMRVIAEYGSEKGSLGRAVADAIRLWLKQKEAPARKK